jgi:hypothetical protein
MRRLVILCAAVVAIACSDSTDPASKTVAQKINVNGAYALVTVNGSPTPVLLGQDDTAKLELLGSAMTLEANTNFREVFSLRLTAPSGVQMRSDTVAGTFVSDGATVVFKPADGSPTYQMTVTDAHTLTENDPGFVIVYHRN